MKARLTRRWALASVAAAALLWGCDKILGMGDDDDDDKRKEGDAAAATSTATSTAAVADGDSTGVPECDEFVRVMNCMKSKAPPEQRAMIEQSTKQVLELVKTLGPMADQACKQGLEQQQALIAEVGCTKGGDVAATPGGKPPVAPAAGAAKFSMDGIKTIAESCGKPFVILATTSKDKGTSYPWPWARQALFANPQFKPVGEPTAVHQVTFDTYETDQAILLVGRCWNGGTCNRLAAMYKSIVRVSKPQLFCGSLPVQGTKHPAFVIPSDNYWLPAPDDAIAKCARLAACKITANPATPGDPGMECQRAPSSFKLECAMKDSCAAVNLCAGG